MQVAVLGTGTMGTGMAQSLLREGHAVRAWNRSRERAEALTEVGAEVADTAAEAVAGADAVLLMLFDADAVLEVLGDVAAAVEPDAVIVQSSTVGLDGIRRIAGFAEQHSLTLLDAPVLGTKQPAAEGKLVVLVSGDDGARQRVQPVLDAIGAKTVPAGLPVGAATALKLVANAWVTALTAATAQSLALAQGLGLDPRLFLEAIAGGPADSPYAQLKGASMLKGDFPPAFVLDGALKDLRLIQAAAAEAGVDPTVVDAVEHTFASASDAGHGGEDIAAVYAVLRPTSAS